MTEARQVVLMAWQCAWATVHTILVLGMFAGCLFALALIIKEHTR